MAEYRIQETGQVVTESEFRELHAATSFPPQITQEMANDFGADVVLGDGVVEEILRRANRSENGARMLESIIDGALLPPVSLQLLQRLSAGQPISRVRFSVADHQFMAEVEG